MRSIWELIEPGANVNAIQALPTSRLMRCPHLLRQPGVLLQPPTRAQSPQHSRSRARGQPTPFRSAGVDGPPQGFRRQYGSWEDRSANILSLLFSLRIINLRPLQRIRIIHVHRFPRGEEVDRLRPLPVPVAGVLHSAKGQMHLRTDGWRVDVRNTGL